MQLPILFRILLAGSVILPFADAIAQTSPAPTEASTSSASSASPDKKWEYVAGDNEPKLLKAATKEIVLDLGEQGPGSVLWAPDSKRFALEYARGHQSSLYQLRDDHWVELESPDAVAFKRADAVLAAEAKREGVPKKASRRTPSWSIEADEWVDASTLVMHASLSKRFEWGEDDAKDLSRDFLFTFKFDDAGKWKIVKMHQTSKRSPKANNDIVIAGDPEPTRIQTDFAANTPRKPSVEINAALGVSAFVLAATVGGFRMGLLVMIAVNGSQGRTLRREVVNHW